MLHFLPYLILALAPDTATLATQLGHPKFVVRDRAEKKLMARMSWVLAMRLSQAEPINAEAAVRLKRLADSPWREFPCWPDCPYIDSLSNPNCISHNALTRYYYGLASGWQTEAPMGCLYPTFRLGTAFLIADLTRWKVPPTLIRLLLSVMEKRSRDWDKR